MRLKLMLTAIRPLAVAFGCVIATSVGVAAQEVQLRLHQFLPAAATLPSQVLKPWAQELNEASDGRIAITHFDAMSLGGRPQELMDQARDGVADISMAIIGYTPGRFPQSEVFELPFIMSGSGATAKAFWELVETDLQQSEFSEVRVLAVWTHGPGAIHGLKPVRRLEDMRGQKLRGPTRIINDLLQETGAIPVGIPLPDTAESLSKGVIDGTVISWEVVPSLRLAELVHYHTDFSGDHALYTTAIILVMNRNRYDALPDDLREILDTHSGAALSARAATAMADYDERGREAARAAGNEIILLDEPEVDRWKAVVQPVYERWYGEMEARGIDGRALEEQVRALIAKHQD